MVRRGAWRWLVVAAVAAVGLGLAWHAPSPRVLSPAARQPVLWRGAYHVHSTQSDGSGSPLDVAAAAAAAGLDFVILTDHGDATRPPAAPRLVDGVLLIDAVEISTDDGHYVALGLPAAPYPLAGEGRAVAEDVRRLGGVGILAHPNSPRQDLAWHDPSVNADGFEWVNADTTWRAAGAAQLAVRLLTYPFNRSGALAALATYPADLFAARDDPARPPQLALAAVDAHARIGWRRDADPTDGGRTLAAFPSYRASFGTFGVVVPWVNGGPTGDASHDATAVLRAIAGRVAWTAVFSMASPVWLSLEANTLAGSALPGPDATGPVTLSVQSNAPDGASIRLLRNGVALREWTSPEVSLPLAAGEPAAVYRAEVWLPARRGWPALPLAVSAARGHNLPDVPASGARLAVPQPGADRIASVNGWHVEHDPASTATIAPTPAGALVEASLGLGGGDRVSQFAALVADVSAIPADATGVSLVLSASAPTRMSVQWRQPQPGEGLRWRHSVYLDATPRTVVLPAAEFRPIDPATGSVRLDRVHALLLVTRHGQRAARGHAPPDRPRRRLDERPLEWNADGKDHRPLPFPHRAPTARLPRQVQMGPWPYMAGHRDGVVRDVSA